jgi:hypothetical protein
MTRRWAAFALPVLAAIVMGACSTSDLNFRADTRVKFRTPAARQTVQLPVTVAWEASSLPTGSHFGVFVDRAPVKPGHGLGALSPDELHTQNVYVTDATSLAFDTLPDTNAGKRHQAKETQRVTIVYLDAGNRRVGESAFALEFFLKRQKPS